MKRFIKVIATAALMILMLTNIFLLVSCDKRVKEDTVYYIDLKESKIMDVSTTLLLAKESNIVLRKDGTATVFLRTSEALGGVLNYALSKGLASDFDLQPIIDGIVLDLFPGFTLEDMRLSLNLLKSSLNLTLVGFDPDDPSVAVIFQSISDTGKLPASATLPNGLGIEYNSEYHIEKVTSEYTGEYTGVFMGAHHKNGEPYVMMTLQTQADSDKQQLYYRNEMLNLSLIAKEK